MNEPAVVAFRTPEQIAQRTGLSRKAIYRAIDRGELTAYRLCGRLRIHPNDEHAWIEQNRVNAASAPTPKGDLRPRPAAAQHGLRRLLQAQEKPTGLVATQPYDPTADNGNALAATATPRGRHQDGTP